MDSKTDKKAGGWFKGFLSANQTEKNNLEQQNIITEVPKEVEAGTNDVKTASVFSKENQDKVALDVIVAIEDILKDRQLLTYKNKGLGEQLDSANETIHRLKQDIEIKEQIIVEKNNEILELENQLTSKQMSYDQLLEDYKEYQYTSKMEYEKTVDQLETEKSKYTKLTEDFKQVQYESMAKINDLEEKIRSLITENQRYAEQYQNIANEKEQLMKTIANFTEQMSFSFLSKPISNSQSEENK